MKVDLDSKNFDTNVIKIGEQIVPDRCLEKKMIVEKELRKEEREMNYWQRR